MRLDLFALWSPLVGALLFCALEQTVRSQRARLHRLIPTTVIHAIGIAVSVGLSLFALVPLVLLAAPLQVASFADWEAPPWLRFTVSFLFLDFIQYLSHRLHHGIPALWRLHRLHHSDPEPDALTTLLHHPLEIASGFVIVVLAAVLFDVPVLVLAGYSVVYGLHSAFSHLDRSLPERLDRALRWVLVTPNFHRAHHLADPHRHNRNFGALFVFWDVLLRTTAEPPHDGKPQSFGLDRAETPATHSVAAYLSNPLQ